MREGRLYRVVIRSNFVIRVEECERQDGDVVFESKLETGTQLAQNHRKNGCVDGDYLFNSIHVAKDFAVLSLDFTQKLAEKSMAQIEEHNFHTEPNWSNSSFS